MAMANGGRASAGTGTRSWTRSYTGRTKASLSFRIHGGPGMRGTVLAEGDGLMTEEMYAALVAECSHFGRPVVALDDVLAALREKRAQLPGDAAYPERDAADFLAELFKEGKAGE